MAFGFSAGEGYGAGSSVLESDSAHGTVLVPDTELLQHIHQGKLVHFLDGPREVRLLGGYGGRVKIGKVEFKGPHAFVIPDLKGLSQVFEVSSRKQAKDRPIRSY